VTKELRDYGVGFGVIAAALIVYTVWFVRRKAPQIIV
jgi:hypothetical protein